MDSYGKAGTLISCHFFFSSHPKRFSFLRPDVCKLKFEGKTFYVIGTQKEVRNCFSTCLLLGVHACVCTCVCAGVPVHEKVSGMTCTCSNVAPKDHDVKVCGDTGNLEVNNTRFTHLPYIVHIRLHDMLVTVGCGAILSRFKS